MEGKILCQSLPLLVKNLANWFELDLSIKLFGVQIFSFHWPPKENSEKPNLQNL